MSWPIFFNVGADVIKQMLPMIATMAMGVLSRETQAGQQQSMLGSFLDRDNDGSALDDVMDFPKKFF